MGPMGCSILGSWTCTQVIMALSVLGKTAIVTGAGSGTSPSRNKNTKHMDINNNLRLRHQLIFCTSSS